MAFQILLALVLVLGVLSLFGFVSLVLSCVVQPFPGWFSNDE